MTTTVTCPRCGTKNHAEAMNCAACRINLEFACGHPAEIERLKLEDARRRPSEMDTSGNYLADTLASKEESILWPGLLLLGAFIFAFCLGEAVHELGHFLVHRAYGVEVGSNWIPSADR